MPDLRVYRPAWDTLVVVPEPPVRAWVFGSARPDSVTLSVVDGDGFVVAGRASRLGPQQPLDRPWRLAFADAALPSGAPLMVDVCVRTPREAGQAEWACEQVPLRASPKRVSVAFGVTYPVDGDPDRLVAAARVSVSRPASVRPGETRWSPVPPPDRFLLRLTPDVPGAVPLVAALPPPGDTLDLGGRTGYDAYWLALQQRLFYGEAARVDIALVRPEALQRDLALVRRTLRAPSVDDRRAEVQRLARAARLAVGQNRPDLDGQSVAASPTRWRYDRLRRRYEIGLAVSAVDTLGRPFRWVGSLTAADGGQARVQARATDSTAASLDFTFPHAPRRRP